MNKIKFYELLLAFVTRDSKEDEVWTRKLKDQLIKSATDASIDFFFDEDFLVKIDYYSFWEGESYFYRFMERAFKDLSTFRHPKAAQIFREFRSLATVQNWEIVWASKVIPKLGGQSTLTLHVTSSKAWPMLSRLGVKVDDAALSNGLVMEQVDGRVFCT